MTAPRRVGVSALPRPVQGSLRAYPAHTIDVFSVRAIARAGGVPLVLPCVAPELAAAQLAPLHALVLSGGHDVDAALYGQAAHPRSVGIDPDRDRWELALAAAARARGLRILGVCRGAQLLNVDRGGTLHGHLDESEAHELDLMDPAGRHPVEIAPGSRLSALLGHGSAAVASHHHQGIDVLGAGLTVSARAPDGVIEAVETEDGSEVGVQWHPEFQLDERAGQPLFHWVTGTDERTDG